MITFLKSLNKITILTVMLSLPLLISCNDNEKSNTSVEENASEEITLEQKSRLSIMLLQHLTVQMEIWL